jgi:hypothetical protein
MSRNHTSGHRHHTTPVRSGAINIITPFDQDDITTAAQERDKTLADMLKDLQEMIGFNRPSAGEYQQYKDVYTDERRPGVDVYTTPHWSLEKALKELDIRRIEFDSTDEQMQLGALGYSHHRVYAVRNDLATKSPKTDPIRVTAHELSHITLGHTSRPVFVWDQPAIEYQAELAAMFLLQALHDDQGTDFDPTESLDYLNMASEPMGHSNPPEELITQAHEAALTILAAGTIEPPEDIVVGPAVFAPEQEN